MHPNLRNSAILPILGERQKFNMIVLFIEMDNCRFRLLRRKTKYVVKVHFLWFVRWLIRRRQMVADDLCMNGQAPGLVGWCVGKREDERKVSPVCGGRDEGRQGIRRWKPMPSHRGEPFWKGGGGCGSATSWPPAHIFLWGGGPPMRMAASGRKEIKKLHTEFMKFPWSPLRLTDISPLLDSG